MPSTFEFCLPTGAASVPNHPVWLHEVKYDGYRLIVARDGDRVRLVTRGGYHWAGRFPSTGAGAKRLVDDGLDGPCAATAFDATAKATMDMLGMAQHIVSGTDGIADIVVAEDVAGTDDHENIKGLR